MRSLGNITSKKIGYLQLGCIFVGGLILLRLLHLQAHLSYHFYARGEKNFLRIIPIQPSRGNILDKHGKLLATNRPVSNVYFTGSGQKNITPIIIEKLKKLETIIEKKLDNDPQLMTTLKRAEKNNDSIMLACDLTFEQLSKIEELFPNDPNISIITSMKRFYPHETFAAHALGYLGKFDFTPAPIGRMGIEQVCETLLHGHYGSHLKKINSFGKNLAEIDLKQALTGQHIYTTLDIDLQKIAEAIFPLDESGTIIVMNPHDGSLQAIVSRPTFDPNIFIDPISPTEWKKLQENQPFINRAFNACYPPGSLFKLVTISAALEHGIIKQDALWYCNGYLTYHGRRYWCHLHTGHRELSTCQALAHSCNILFYSIGKKIDIDLLAHYAHTFGLGTKTEMPFCEKEGLIPTRAWKRKTKGERWWQGETLSASIGQSFLLVTPIQIARMIGSIFTGYLVKPRLLQQDPIITQPLQLKPETIKFLQQSMKLVVTDGTGQQINSVKDITIYGKTSTAQTSMLQKRDMGKTYQEHAWFVAHVQYKKEAPFIIVVCIEHCGSSRKATMTVKRFLQQYKLLINGTTETLSNNPNEQTQLPYEWTDASSQLLPEVIKTTEFILHEEIEASEINDQREEVVDEQEETHNQEEH